MEQLGRIRHLLAPNLAHWMFLKDWQDAAPGAVTWAAPGLRRRMAPRRTGLRIDRQLAPRTPAEWDQALELVLVPGGLGFHEAVLFHRPSRTLVLTDLVVSLEGHKLPAAMRVVARWFGSLSPNGMAPPYLRGLMKLGHGAARNAGARLVALRPEKVIFAHGRCFEHDGEAALRQALRWLAT